MLPPRRGSVPISYPGPDSAPILISNNLALIFDYSVKLCEGRNSGVSYSSVLLCFTIAPDDLSLRFSRFAEHAYLRAIANFGKFDLTQLPLIPKSSSLSDGKSLEHRNLWGAKFSSLLITARQFAERISPDKVVGVRHLMAAYIYDQDVRRQQLLRDWNLDSVNWALWFLQQMEALRPGEIEEWQKIDTEFGGSRPNISASAGALGQEPKRRTMLPSLLSDKWTTSDKLGYARYAYGLYRFLTNKSTELPVSISIQAPWGGGKTSLMRMIRNYMDKQADIIEGQTSPQTKDDAESGRLTLANVLEEIETLFTDTMPQVRPAVGETPDGGRITVWFNPWKYENTEQVWSGLAETIISGIARRCINPIERERFWLRLNLNRIDADKLRRQIHAQILEKVARTYIRWLHLLVPIAVFGILMFVYSFINKDYRFAAIPGIIAALGPVMGKELITRVGNAQAEKEPAALGFKDVISAPDYGTKAGFIHQASRDLAYALKAIGDEKLVIFIDDLDRCSPKATAEVFDGLNRFISSEFPNCAVIIGMDDEVVASALNSAYSMRSGIDSTNHNGDEFRGRKFMDKFIQLPFLLPEPEPTTLVLYKDSLLAIDTGKDLPAIFARGIAGVTSLPREAARSGLEKFAETEKLTALEKKYLLLEYEARLAVDTQLSAFENQSKVICDDLAGKLPPFLNNPRDLKRSVNSARFLFVFEPLERALRSSIFIAQVVLGTKWPEVHRFLQKREIETRSPFADLLNDAISSAGQSSTVEGWGAVLSSKWGIQERPQWAFDPQLYIFLKGLTTTTSALAAGA